MKTQTWAFGIWRGSKNDWHRVDGEIVRYPSFSAASKAFEHDTGPMGRWDYVAYLPPELRSVEAEPEEDPVLAAAASTCVTCNEVGHLDCALRDLREFDALDPKGRKAAPTYAAVMALIGGTP